MTIRIILLGAGGELDRQIIEFKPSATAVLGDHVYSAIGVWKDTLAPGDTIKIVEVE